MKIILILLFISNFINSQFANGQIIFKPIGCSASGTTTVHIPSLSHLDNRYMLLKINWATIEPSPGVFDFSNLILQINIVNSYNKKYAIAVIAGGTGTPLWLKNILGAPTMPYVFQSNNLELPLWWDATVQLRMEILANALGAQFASDASLALIYVPQMTANGIEGHLNGINMTTFYSYGFTQSNWINAAKETAKNFAEAFPNKAIAFEVHEVDETHTIPATIINDLFNDSSLCQRVGAGIWWLSGKTTYQTNLLSVLQNFQGDKYAQTIGRSDQLERFQDNTIATAFSQAQTLGIRYIEPWIFEYQNNTINNLLQDFNTWADLNFTLNSICTLGINQNNFSTFKIYPNPTKNEIFISSAREIKSISISNLLGQIVINKNIKSQSTAINVQNLAKGMYIISVVSDNNKIENHKFIKE